MVALSSNVTNNGNKLANLLGSQTSVIEKFMPQSSTVAIGNTVNTLVIEFDQEKYKEFLHTNSLSNKYKNTFGIAANVIHCRTSFQVHIPKKTNIGIMSSTNYQCTSTIQSTLLLV